MTVTAARAAAIAAGLALAATAVGCGGSSKPQRSSGGTAFLQAARCADWRRADKDRRAEIIHTLGRAATKPDPESHGATLSDSRAYAVFQRACSTRASQSSVLYEIYNRAAAFQSVGR